ncbi:MAG: hypothetical protein ACT4NJ_08220 [Nitrosopumilaceae archaeon]
MSQQVKHKKFAITAAIIGVIAAGVIGTYFVSAQTTLTQIPTTQEEQQRYDAMDVAKKYIVTSPTFVFDGLPATLDVEDVSIMESYPVQYQIKVAFDSSHGGFGNREGQILTQVITPHKVDIIVSEGEVLSAVTDEVWDEMNHQYVLKKPQQKLPSSDEPITSSDGIVTDYPSLIDAIKSRGVLVKYIEEIAAEGSSFSVPIKVISVGGADIQVYEFQSESDAQVSSLTISEDGTEIGTSIIRWMDTPHFYTKGKIIVLYVGQNPEITNLLESFLGTQFAGM